MVKYKFLQPHHWIEKPNYFLKPMIFFSITVIFYLLQIANTITYEILYQPVDPRITQLLAVHYDCSKQYNMRQVSLAGVQTSNQAHSGFGSMRIFAFVFARVEAKRTKFYRRSANNQIK